MLKRGKRIWIRCCGSGLELIETKKVMEGLENACLKNKSKLKQDQDRRVGVGAKNNFRSTILLLWVQFRMSTSEDFLPAQMLTDFYKYVEIRILTWKFQTRSFVAVGKFRITMSWKNTLLRNSNVHGCTHVHVRVHVCVLFYVMSGDCVHVRGRVRVYDRFRDRVRVHVHVHDRVPDHVRDRPVSPFIIRCWFSFLCWSSFFMFSLCSSSCTMSMHHVHAPCLCLIFFQQRHSYTHIYHGKK